MTAQTISPGKQQLQSNTAHASSLSDTGGLFGHPRGLTTLFFTELWERFSFYGMRAILVLYMVAAVKDGGLGFNVKDATQIYGVYQMMCYLLTLPGGILADRVLGARRSVLIGGIIIALGHFTLAFASVWSFFAGLILIVTGTGMLKPNISSMLGSLYGKDDHRRDGGFSIFYMGINIGAAMAPLVCGYLAQDMGFKNQIAAWGFHPESSWHFGFAAAGVGMCLGLAQYIFQRQRLAAVGSKPEPKIKEVSASSETAVAGESSATAAHIAIDPVTGEPAKLIGPMTAEEWKRLGAIGVLFLFAVLFWAIYEQAGSSLTLFADKFTRHEFMGFTFPSSWFQSLNPVFVMILAPVFSIMWTKMGDKEPSSPVKFTIGIFLLALGIGLMVPAAMLTAKGLVSPLWLVGVYFVECVAELCLSPVGLSTVTKLAPARFLGLFMGLWFLASAVGDYVSGILAGFFEGNADRMVALYGWMGVSALVAAVILAMLSPLVRKLMVGVR